MLKIEKKNLKAVYEDDVEKFLTSLGLIEAMAREEIHCIVCGNTVTTENFGGIIRKNNKLNIFCSDIKCYIKVLKIRHE